MAKSQRLENWMLVTFQTKGGKPAQHFATTSDCDQTYRSLCALQ